MSNDYDHQTFHPIDNTHAILPSMDLTLCALHHL